MKSREIMIGQFGGVFPSRDWVIEPPTRHAFVRREGISRSNVAARQYPGSKVVDLTATPRGLQGIPRDHSSTRHGNKSQEMKLR